MAKPGGKLPGNYPYGGEKSTNGEQALRIPITHLEDPQFGETLRQLVGKLEALPEHIDLLVESGLLSASAPTFSYVCRRVPMLKRWRTFTVLAGAFPPDLIAFKKPGQSEIPREEWTRWISETQQVPALPRRPTFGDYTIQHPSYQEPIEGANPTASIRYACDTYWIIMRGQALRKRGGARTVPRER